MYCSVRDYRVRGSKISSLLAQFSRRKLNAEFLVRVKIKYALESACFDAIK